MNAKQLEELLGHPLSPESMYGGDGYAAQPGTGPADRKCKDCAHYTRIQFSKSYPKCGLMALLWMGGPKTDIKANAPACSEFSEKGSA